MSKKASLHFYRETDYCLSVSGESLDLCFNCGVSNEHKPYGEIERNCSVNAVLKLWLVFEDGSGDYVAAGIDSYNGAGVSVVVLEDDPKIDAVKVVIEELGEGSLWTKLDSRAVGVPFYVERCYATCQN